MRLICLSILCLACLFPATAQTIAVNEIMASNATTIADEDGDFGDWIELYNYGGEEVNLEGLGLSDDYDDPFKWVFPDTTLQAGKFILIWASGKNRVEPGLPLHTNFSISSEGEEIILTGTGMVRIDEHPPTHIPTDISYGRYPDGTGEFFYFDQPTPLGTNTTQGFTGLLSSPVFSHGSGFYADSFYLKVTHPDPEVILRYTLDGSEPDQESDLFPDSLLIYDRANEPDQISSIPTTSITAPEWYRWMPPMDTVYKGTNIRIKPFREGALNPFAGTKIYWVDDDSTSGYSLPVISLSVEEDDLFGADGIFTNYSRTGDYWERPAHITFFEPDGTKGFSTEAGIRVHGGNSRRYALKSFRIYIRNEYGKSQIDYPVFPDQEMNVHERLILRNAGSDWARTYFRDPFVQSILKGISDVDYQAYRPAVLFINGEYWGVTNIRERYDNKYIEHHYGHTEIDMLEGTGQTKYGSNSHYRNLISFLQNESIEDPENWDWVQTRMDVEDFRDYHILQVFSMNTDQPGKNVRFWRPQTPEGKWRWLWWDMDDTFLFGPHNNYDRNGLVYCTGLDSISAWSVNLATPPPAWAPNGPAQTFPLRALLMSTEFRNDFINRFADLLNTAFRPDYLEYMIDSFRMQIDDHIYDHYRRWHRPEPEMHETHIQYLHDFAANRQQYMREHIVEFFHLGGDYSLKLDIASGEGHIRVNSIHINSEMPSLKEPVYPWEGIYFKGVPLIIEAIPAEGYVFDYWEGTENIFSKLIDVNGEEDISLKAHFIKEEPSENELIFFWLFDASLPNDTPLESLDVSYYAVNPATLDFHSALNGYPFNNEHPNWRKASMERRNAPTNINYRPDANNFIDYEDTDMRGLQVRQPFAGDGGENIMIFNMPTGNYEDVLFRFAAKDEGAAEHMLIDYSLDEGDGGGDWITDGLSDEILTLNDQFLLYAIDFSEIPGADNNPEFKIRIRFDGSDMAADEGNRVTFNNISLEGVPVVTGLPPGPADREREEPDLTIYPNPANSILIIESEDMISEIRIINYSGQVLYNSNVHSDHHMIDISGLQSGIYLIVVNTGKGTVTRRVQVMNQ